MQSIRCNPSPTATTCAAGGERPTAVRLNTALTDLGMGFDGKNVIDNFRNLDYT
jgi:hypothetical protein